jgi:hypothetical protein
MAVYEKWLGMTREWKPDVPQRFGRGDLVDEVSNPDEAGARRTLTLVPPDQDGVDQVWDTAKGEGGGLLVGSEEISLTERRLGLPVHIFSGPPRRRFRDRYLASLIGRSAGNKQRN